jgi:hypothetical protein
MFAQHELVLGDHADHTRHAMMAVAYDDISQSLIERADNCLYAVKRQSVIA